MNHEERQFSSNDLKKSIDVNTHRFLLSIELSDFLYRVHDKENHGSI